MSKNPQNNIMFATDHKGGAQPPPSRLSSCTRTLWPVVLALLLVLCPAYSLAQPQKPTSQSATQSANPQAVPQSSKRTSKKTPKPSNLPSPHASAWAFSQGPREPSPADHIWTRGLAPKALREAAVVGLKNKALKSQVKAPPVPQVAPPSKNRVSNIESPPQPHSSEGLPLGKGLRVRSDSLNSSWHNSAVKNDMRIDQDTIRQETNVYGAYSDIEAGEDVTFSAGPEFTHTRTQNSTQHTPVDTGVLGVGMQLKWGF